MKKHAEAQNRRNAASGDARHTARRWAVLGLLACAGTLATNGCEQAAAPTVQVAATTQRSVERTDAKKRRRPVERGRSANPERYRNAGFETDLARTSAAEEAKDAARAMSRLVAIENGRARSKNADQGPGFSLAFLEQQEKTRLASEKRRRERRQALLDAVDAREKARVHQAMSVRSGDANATGAAAGTGEGRAIDKPAPIDDDMENQEELSQFERDVRALEWLNELLGPTGLTVRDILGANNQAYRTSAASTSASGPASGGGGANGGGANGGGANGGGANGGGAGGGAAGGGNDGAKSGATTKKTSGGSGADNQSNVGNRDIAADSGAYTLQSNGARLRWMPVAQRTVESIAASGRLGALPADQRQKIESLRFYRTVALYVGIEADAKPRLIIPSVQMQGATNRDGWLRLYKDPRFGGQYAELGQAWHDRYPTTVHDTVLTLGKARVVFTPGGQPDRGQENNLPLVAEWFTIDFDEIGFHQDRARFGDDRWYSPIARITVPIGMRFRDGETLQSRVLCRIIHGDGTAAEARLLVPDIDAYTGNFDINGDGTVSIEDITALQDAFGEAPLPGDINNDGVVAQADIEAVRSAWGKKGENLPEDLNGDGQVDAIDLTRIVGMLAGGRAVGRPVADLTADGVVDADDLRLMLDSFLFGDKGPP